MGGHEESDQAPGQIRVRVATRDEAAHFVDFNRAMAEETEGRTLPEKVVCAGVQAVLDNPLHGFYVAAESDGLVVGGLLVTYEWSDWRNGLFLWIQSVYVEPGHRGRGIYRRLYEFVRERARERDDVCGLRLYADESNEVAHAVYESLGMSRSEYRVYEEALAR